MGGIISKHIDIDLIDELKMLINATDMFTDNNEKADMISKCMRKQGFKEIGCGTNRIVFRKGRDVFKIALDDQGSKDNDSEYDLSVELYPYVTKCYATNGIISVHEYVNPIRSIDVFEEYWNDIKIILDKLSEKYIIDDIGPKSFMNWGIREEDDQPVILDYAYMMPSEYVDFTCHTCNEGELHYADKYTKFVCDVCGARFNIAEIKEQRTEQSWLDELYGADESCECDAESSKSPDDDNLEEKYPDDCFEEL